MSRSLAIPQRNERRNKSSNAAPGTVNRRASSSTTATAATGAFFDRRLGHLGITQIRTPFRSPRANAIAERWVRSARTECLDLVLIFSERHLRHVLAEYVSYFNCWRPHRSIGQRAPRAPPLAAPRNNGGNIIATPVLGGLHHIYNLAA